MQEKEVCRPHAGQFPFGKKISRPLRLGQLLALQQAVCPRQQRVEHCLHGGPRECPAVGQEGISSR